jgi:hypothetical protein
MATRAAVLGGWMLGLTICAVTPAIAQVPGESAHRLVDSATKLVRETVRRDARGDRLYGSHDPRWVSFYEVLSDPENEILGDAFDAIWGYDITAGTASGDTATVAVTYDVIGLVHPVFRNDRLAGWKVTSGNDSVTTHVYRHVYEVVRTSRGLKIVAPLPAPHVLASALLQRSDYPMLSRADSLLLKKWAAREPQHR